MILRKTTFQLAKPYGLVSNRAFGEIVVSLEKKAEGIMDSNCNVSHTYTCLYGRACVRMCVYSIYLSLYFHLSRH